MTQIDHFVLVRVAGRGDWRIYHRLAGDAMHPVCGAPIQPEQWDAIAESDARRASRHGPARRCCTRCKAQEEHLGNADTSDAA